jgi:hypothetical protein
MFNRVVLKAAKGNVDEPRQPCRPNDEGEKGRFPGAGTVTEQSGIHPGINFIGEREHTRGLVLAQPHPVAFLLSCSMSLNEPSDGDSSARLPEGTF